LVVRYGSFADLARCITDFSQVNKFQKISLQAIEMVRGLVPKMLECPECLLPQPAADDAPAEGQVANGKGVMPGERMGGTEEPMVKYWLPVLNSFYEIIMTGEDLEVRRLSVVPSRTVSANEQGAGLLV
jgi:brefeldin A-inhibited guanine nucleotide-exchange protein